ncbi:hypothetical protein [Novipirellula aureliae]|uniref:hypothetical protein n=1 Tax=Novipirellula aureliae TaxID=2527966 RepID=UPI0011B74B14|nr:hypothetical protein [Novipirellula aureliae]
MPISSPHGLAPSAHLRIVRSTVTEFQYRFGYATLVMRLHPLSIRLLLFVLVVRGGDALRDSWSQRLGETLLL